MAGVLNTHVPATPAALGPVSWNRSRFAKCVRQRLLHSAPHRAAVESRTQHACKRQRTEVRATAEDASDSAAVTPAAASLFPDIARYRRVMLKVSGEALQGGFVAGTDPKVLQVVAREVATAAAKGIQIAIVVGGGNFFRGADAWKSWGLERATADNVGMLATCMNAIMLQSAIEKEGVEVRVQTAIEMREIAEPFIRRRAIRHLERGRVVIFGAGTGNPFMTTDTAAALRAAEIEAEVFLKATKVDGIFDCDPVKNAGAKLHRQLSFRQVMVDNLEVMDGTAITLCKENDIKVVVFNISTPGNIMKAIVGDSSVGTLVSGSLVNTPLEGEEGRDWQREWNAHSQTLEGVQQ